jgi:hypothetical protein
MFGVVVCQDVATCPQYPELALGLAAFEPVELHGERLEPVCDDSVVGKVCCCWVVDLDG